MRGLAAVIDGAIGHVDEGYQAPQAQRAWEYTPDAEQCLPACRRDSLDSLTLQVVEAIAAIGDASLVDVVRHTGLPEEVVRTQLRRITHRKGMVFVEQVRIGRRHRAKWTCIYSLQVRLV